MKINEGCCKTVSFVLPLPGARATWGVTSGKVCFEVKLIEVVNCSHAQSAGRSEEINLNDFRVGFSAAGANNQLGEDKHSYAMTMSGKKCTQKYFEVGCCLCVAFRILFASCVISQLPVSALLIFPFFALVLLVVLLFLCRPPLALSHRISFSLIPLNRTFWTLRW